MALTIYQSPDAYSLSGNPLTFVFSSDQSGQANFSYKVEVSIDAVLIETHFLLPEFGAKCHFDASDICERYCQAPEELATDIYNASTDVSLTVDIIENYGTPPSDWLNSATTIDVIKGKQRKADFLNFTPADYVFGAAKLWQTKFPRAEKNYINLALDNKFQYITNAATLILTVVLKNDGIVVATKFSPLVVQENVSLVNINTTVLINDYLFSQANIDASNNIEIEWDSGVAQSETLTLWLDDRCYSSSYKHLVFMNTLGAFENYTFIKRTVEKTKIKGIGFEQQFGYYDAAGAYVYNLGGVTDYVKQLEDTIGVQSDWVSESEYAFLCQELLTSPVVYLQSGSDLIKVKVQSRGYKLKTSENDMVFNLKVEIFTERDISTVV